MTNLEIIQNHLHKVQVNANKLANQLNERGDEVFSRRLIALSYIHDNSKFFGIEWLYLNDETKEKEPILFYAALEQHQKSNPHHPEYWGNITDMPRLYLAEFVCDTIARSQEFGTDYREWLDNYLKSKQKLKPQNKVFKEIKSFTDLLLEKPFK